MKGWRQYAFTGYRGLWLINSAKRYLVYENKPEKWGCHDHDAITAATAKLTTAEQWLRQDTAAEHELRRQLADLAEHQEQRAAPPDSAHQAKGKTTTMVRPSRTSPAGHRPVMTPA
jgi:hypothetical protein